ncbi:hypothetical protein OG571_47710 (plasmid) [Streptomyces sp. NBC_01369]|uniref:hypothetical protein n=1 Tax=Streptomyces sp. NBC_01369 TaxID=2903842 RepID=UPI002F90F066
MDRLTLAALHGDQPKGNATGVAPDLAAAIIAGLRNQREVEPPTQAQHFDDINATIAQTSRLITHLEEFRELAIIAADDTGPHADRKATAIATGFPPSRLYRVLDTYSRPRDRKDPEAVARPATQKKALEEAVRRHPGQEVDTRRAVAYLEEAGHPVTDKRARQLLRDLAAAEVITKTDPSTATYRTAEQ